jgi:hypothetical protein
MARDAHMVRQSWAGLRLPLIPALIIMLAQGSLAATITVHDSDANGRVFVDVVGDINPDDAEIFESKTANLRNVIIALGSARFKDCQRNRGSFWQLCVFWRYW